MEKEQVGNTEMVPESETNIISEDDSGDFFSALDQSINGEIIEPSQSTSDNSGNTQTSPSEVQQQDV